MNWGHAPWKSLTIFPRIVDLISHSICDNVAKLQKRAVRFITNSKYNAQTELLFLKICIYQRLKTNLMYSVWNFWYTFSNNTLPNYFGFMFQYNSS